MRRVFLLFSAGALLAACNKDELPPQNSTIYFADKIVETTLPTQGTQTLTTEQHYEYANLQFGLVSKHTSIEKSGSVTGTTTVEETSYNGVFPKEMMVTVNGTKQKTVTFNEYTQGGRLLKKTTLNEAAPNLPIVEEYKYDRYNGDVILKEHSRSEKKATGETVYTVAAYSYTPSNIEMKTSVYTVTNGSTSSATVIATDTYMIGSIFGIAVVRSHTHTANGVTTITSFSYDGRTNPNFLLYSYRLTHPELFLNENYARSNITKKSVRVPNVSGQDYEEETSYNYFKGEYPQTATVKQGSKVIRSKQFVY